MEGVSFKKILSFVLAVVLSGGVAAYILKNTEDKDEGNNNSIQSSAITNIQLATPEIIDYQNNVIYWMPVNNADKYYVKVNNAEYISYNTCYTISLQTEGSFTCSVKAVADNGIYQESKWSETRKFDYVKGQNSNTFLQTGGQYGS